jgi:flagellar basal body-associated protein FliL
MKTIIIIATIVIPVSALVFLLVRKKKKSTAAVPSNPFPENGTFEEKEKWLVDAIAFFTNAGNQEAVIKYKKMLEDLRTSIPF